jgi:hypothetical protein
MSFYTATQIETLYAMPSNATAVTAAAQTVLSKGTTAAPYQLPANFFQQQSGNGPGKSLLIKGGGFFTTSSTAMTDTFQIALDTTAGTAGTVIAATGAFTPTASVTNGAFRFEAEITAQVMGSAGVLSVVGNLFWGTGANAAVASPQIFMLGAPNAGVTGFATTGAYYVELFNTWSLATGAPSVTLTNYTIFGLN